MESCKNEFSSKSVWWLSMFLMNEPLIGVSDSTLYVEKVGFYVPCEVLVSLPILGNCK